MIRVVLAGVTGWVGRALLPAIVASPDLKLVAAVSRKAAGKDAGEAAGAAPLGVTVVATLAEALAVTFRRAGRLHQAGCRRPQHARGHRGRPPRRGRRLRARRAMTTRRSTRRRATKNVGVLAAGNFSITATLLKRFALEAAKLRPRRRDHRLRERRQTRHAVRHGRELAETLAAVRGAATSKPVDQLGGIRETRGAAVGDGPNGGVRVHALRMPSFVLSVEAVFGADNERLVIRHDAGARPRLTSPEHCSRSAGVAEKPGLRRGLDTLMD